jgi:hypothetical protein
VIHQSHHLLPPHPLPSSSSSHSMIASSIFVSRLLPGDGSFREELSRPWAQPRLRWIPRVGDPPTRQRERVLVGQHHQQEMEEDDDVKSHDENQRRRKQRTDGRAQQCRAMDLEREEE